MTCSTSVSYFILKSCLLEGSCSLTCLFLLNQGQQKRTIKLFHFIEWPDNGVPDSPEVLLEFMQVIKRELETAKAGPLVVHCRLVVFSSQSSVSKTSKCFGEIAVNNGVCVLNCRSGCKYTSSFWTLAKTLFIPQILS